MNKYFEIQFRRKGKLVKVKRQLPNRSIELDEPDPIERRFSIGFAARDDITGTECGGYASFAAGRPMSSD